MSKFTMEFNLPEDREEMNQAIHAGNFHSAIWETSQQVFRPARKHGYSNPQIQSLLDKLNSLVAETFEDTPPQDWPVEYDIPMNATDLICLLEKEFYRILDEEGVSL